MKNYNYLLALLAVGLMQGDPLYALSLKDVLKEAAKGASRPNPQQAQATEPADSGAPPVSGNRTPGGGLEVDFPNQGTWTDPRTGLMWSRCKVGMSWDESRNSCELYSDHADMKPWADAVLKVSKLSLFGYSDWRIPTVQEFATVYYGRERDVPGCNSIHQVDLMHKDGKFDLGCGERSADRKLFPGINGEIIWTATASPEGRDKVMVLVASESETGGFESRPKTPDKFGHNYYVVRGGSGPNFFTDAVSAAQEDKTLEQQVAKAADDAKKAQQAQAAQQAEQDRKAYQIRVAAFQRSLNAGDRAKQGLVIKVSGDLALIQQSEKRCVNPSASGYTCFRWQEFATGEIWIRRSEVLPAD